MSILDNTIATWTMVYGSTDIWINLAIGDLYLMFLYFWTFAYIGYFASFSNMTHHIYICLYMPVIWTMLHLYFGYMIIYGPGCWSGHQLYVHLSIILTQYNTLCFFSSENHWLSIWRSNNNVLRQEDGPINLQFWQNMLQELLQYWSLVRVYC